jgi:2-polyprenyl-3-methyl-5-hydroxy-6-metoxy-1,4-benzoquinol methylase
MRGKSSLNFTVFAACVGLDRGQVANYYWTPEETEMAQKDRSGAVAYFSDQATAFAGHYEAKENFQERDLLWRALLDRYAEAGQTAVDLGCGSGIFSFYLAEKGLQVTAVDGSAEMLALCRQRQETSGLDKVTFHQGMLPELAGLPLEPADLLISSSVVEYVTDLPAMLALFGRLVRPDGLLIVSLPNALCLNRAYQRLKYRLGRGFAIYAHIRHFSTPRRLDGLLQPHGFHLLEHHYYDHYWRVARLARQLRLPAVLTEDLFVGVWRKVNS